MAENKRKVRYGPAPCVAVAALAASVLAVYSNTFAVPFIFDDVSNITENDTIRDLSNFWPPSGTRYLSYLSFALNYQAGGLSPTGYHLVNTAVHLINALLVWLLITLTARTPAITESDRGDASFTGASATMALVAALIFAVHPVQTQAVTYITQRFASLATLFYLLSVVLYIHGRTGGIKRGTFTTTAAYLLSIVSAVAAMKTKEISFTLPFIIVLYEYAFFKGAFKKKLPYMLPFALTLAIIPLSLFAPELGFGEAVEGAGAGIAEKIRSLQVAELTSIPWHEYFFTEMRVVVTYLRLLVWPADQTIVYDYPHYDSILDPAVLASFILLTTLVAGAAYGLTRSVKGQHPWGTVVSFGALWFFITLSIESSVIPIKDVIFEHRLYLPSVGASVAFTAALFYAARRFHTKYGERFGHAFSHRTIAALLIVTVAAPLGGAAFARNSVWKDDLTLWTDTVRKSPGAAIAHGQLATALTAIGKMNAAIDRYRKAISIAPAYSEAHNNLGATLASIGRTDEAIAEFKLAIKHREMYPKAYYNLGLAYGDAAMTEEAAKSFQAAAHYDPAYTDAVTKLALTLASLGRIKDSIKEFERAAELRPESAEYRNNLGYAYYLAGKRERALKELQAALALDPSLKKARRTIDMIMKMK